MTILRNLVVSGLLLAASAAHAVPRLEAVSAAAPACADGGRGGRVRALLVGIDEYRERDAAGRPYFAPLAGSVSDAHLLAEALKRRAGAAPADLRLLLGAEASTEGFFGALDELILAARCGDFVLFHFSGHTWRGALALADASLRSGSGLVFEGELRRAVTALRNRGAFVLVHVDANLPEPLELDVGRGARWRAAGARDAGASELAVDAGGLAVFSAGPLAFEQAVEVPRPDGPPERRVYGLFTFATTVALSDGPTPTIRTLAERIRQRAPARARATLSPAPTFESTEPERLLFATGPAPREAATARVAPARAEPPPAPVSGARVEITSPQRMRGVTLVTTPSVRVEGRVAPADRLAAVVVSGLQARLVGGGRFEADVPLRSGAQTVYAVAVFADHTTATDSLEIGGGPAAVAEQAPAPPPGRRFALVIGNGNYQHVPKLRTAVGDAKAVAALLASRFGFETALDLGEGRSLSLVLQDVGRREVFAALSQLRRRLGEDDSLLLFYAGHGDRPARSVQAYWLPVDAEADDHANWISADDIASEMSLMNARHVLVVADSCFSGGLMRGASGAPAAPAARLERARFFEELERRRSRHLMSSGGNEPVMDDGGGGHSVFASAFLKGLAGMTEDTFSAQQLFANRIQEVVAGHAGQTPQYGPVTRSAHEGGDFVFRRAPAR